MFHSIVLMSLLMGISADASSNVSEATSVPEATSMTAAQKRETGATSVPEATSMTTAQKRETGATSVPEATLTSMTATQKPETRGDNIVTQIWTKLRTPDFLYGAATGAGLLLIIVIILYTIYCCVKKRKEKKTPNELLKRTADLEYGLAESSTQEDQGQVEEATQSLCVNDTESNPDETLDDYLTPVEVHVVTQPSSQSQHEQEANGNGENEPVYASPITKDNSPPSNSTVVKGSTADTEGDIDGDDNGNEDSTPFDKECVPTPHNSDRKRYQSLKRIYENCTKPRAYMNLRLLNSKNDHESGAQAESSSTSAARRTSPAYVNVPKKRPLLPRPRKAKSDRRKSRSTPVVYV